MESDDLSCLKDKGSLMSTPNPLGVTPSVYIMADLKLDLNLARFEIFTSYAYNIDSSLSHECFPKILFINGGLDTRTQFLAHSVHLMGRDVFLMIDAYHSTRPKIRKKIKKPRRSTDVIFPQTRGDKRWSSLADGVSTPYRPEIYLRREASPIGRDKHSGVSDPSVNVDREIKS
ncbi:hypothetical protein RRG08_034682 [Elysia crispata]|uniref:Uncharacterized protein n=1 Tax=Elysia crispata TaxID=231223 RepID=A0AAE0Z0Z4_9GAST|nr:hypothetical protein RRG08_034682 [Elysia crispata]